ncbi:GNAT family N-acetyltransferase [Angustibacter aerolatus]|uniref:N-acetyltransferase n=1 Tax=Angustibacter aerolatus TaxID=1162965 RepID=A0ABQ6JMV8_9ACTN|nr:GNAT family N-acetyltransferase [Angustibacter aerolatus]GMA88459.1 N-acetyltransferase [Angustibacter aerolatus]
MSETGSQDAAARAQVRDAPQQHRYELVLDDRVVGVADYRLDEAAGVLSVPHVEVEPALRGGDLGSVLARGVLDDVRRRSLKVRPLCPFMALYLRRHPDDADLVAG